MIELTPEYLRSLIEQSKSSDKDDDVSDSTTIPISTTFYRQLCEKAIDGCRAPELIKIGFVQSLNKISEEISSMAKEKGWWETDRNNGEMIALMHSELSEALEALRHGNPPSDHIPEFSGAEEEFADTIIRILDLVVARNWRIGEAIVAKMAYNKTRDFKHGGKKF